MSENNDAKHVLLVLISHSDLGGVRPTGFYVDEAAHPWQVFRRMGFTVGLASIAGGVPPQAGRHPGDPVQEQFLHDADISRQLVNTRALAQVNANRYDAVLFVGGHGVMWDFPNNSVVNAVGRNIWERGGIVPWACGIGGYDVVGWQLSDCRQAGHRIHQRRRAKSRALSNSLHVYSFAAITCLNRSSNLRSYVLQHYAHEHPMIRRDRPHRHLSAYVLLPVA